MRGIFQVLFLAGLIAGMSGCRSSGPKFEPRADNAAFGDSQTNGNNSHQRWMLAEPSFFLLSTTNEVPSEWRQPPGDLFRLGPSDVIDIEILAEPASLATAIVGPDGKVYYNLLPGTFVWGLTLTDTKDLLETSLAKFLRVRPEVVVTLRSAGSKKVWLLGGVSRPGVYSLATPMTLLEAISTAGGTGPGGSSAEMADLERSFLMRQGKLLNVDFYRLLRHGDLSQNIYLQPDDFVYVRPSLTSDIYVLGAVVQPNILPYSDGFSLVAAIAGAGGTLPYASLSQVAIVRGSLARPTIAVVDYKDIIKGKAPDVRLAAGDIVYVSFSPFRKLEQFADQILTQFVRTLAINEGNNAVFKNAQPVGVSVGVGAP